MNVSGWIDTKNGAAIWNYDAPSMSQIAANLIADFGDDAGATDLEATACSGEDVTVRVYQAIERARA